MTPFEHANRLWFEDGHTARALREYRALAASDATNPAYLLQLARAERALGHSEECRRLYDALAHLAPRLPEKAREAIERDKRRAQGRAVVPLPAPLTVADLDREQLEDRRWPPVTWRAISSAARSRGMIGVARFAL